MPTPAGTRLLRTASRSASKRGASDAYQTLVETRSRGSVSETRYTCPTGQPPKSQMRSIEVWRARSRVSAALARVATA